MDNISLLNSLLEYFGTSKGKSIHAFCEKGGVEAGEAALATQLLLDDGLIRKLDDGTYLLTREGIYAVNRGGLLAKGVEPEDIEDPRSFWEKSKLYIFLLFLFVILVVWQMIIR